MASTEDLGIINEATPQDRPVLLELLSDRLLSEFPLDSWRRVFLSSAYEAIRFEQSRLTFVCTSPLSAEWSREDLTTLAHRYGGHLEAFAPGPLLSFPESRPALEAAMLLQRASGRVLRIMLQSAACKVAHFELDGSTLQIALGSELDAISKLGQRAARGMIYMSGETYRELAPAIDLLSDAVLLTTEVEDGVVNSAAISLLPPKSALSTFAGLGLT